MNFKSNKSLIIFTLSICLGLIFSGLLILSTIGEIAPRTRISTIYASENHANISTEVIAHQSLSRIEERLYNYSLSYRLCSDKHIQLKFAYFKDGQLDYTELIDDFDFIRNGALQGSAFWGIQQSPNFNFMIRTDKSQRYYFTYDLEDKSALNLPFTEIDGFCLDDVSATTLVQVPLAIFAPKKMQNALDKLDKSSINLEAIKQLSQKTDIELLYLEFNL